ncbi:MAG: hypothetical protein K2P41_09110, partial [Lachnospiraceae bacterium]|nr:hypothetical protein [Lachnospiraceae bacterium]
MAYSLMIAPIDFAGHQKIAARQFFDNYAFFELAPKQAKEYFLWYMNEIPNRIALLWEYMKQEHPETEPFDYSPESLISLWEWYETKIEQVPMTAKEIEARVKIFPQHLESEIRKNKNKFTDETLSLALDISIYLGEAVVKNYPHLHWNYRTRPKREFSVYRPVIDGLNNKMTFEPSQVLFVLMLKSTKEQNRNRLYDLYHHWENEYFI